MSKPSHLETGQEGENKARLYLSQKGYKILETNWRTPIGEVDILAEKDGCLIIVEVKTKTSDKFGHPAEMVNYYKQKKLQKLALLCQKQFNFEDIRIDVISVDIGQKPPIIEHIENAVF